MAAETAEHPQVTWGRLKGWAEAQQVPDDAVIQTDDDHPILDLDYLEPEEATEPDEDDPEDEGEPAVPATLVVQTRWG